MIIEMKATNGTKSIFVHTDISYDEWKEKVYDEDAWDYPVEELDYILENVEDGTFDCTHYALINDDDGCRLYEMIGWGE